MMKILWLSNKAQTNRDSGSTGTWLDALAQGLVTSGDVKLGNVAMGDVTEVTRRDSGDIDQWIIPVLKIGGNGSLPGSFENNIRQVFKEFTPDIVHVWGTEGAWGLLTERKIFDVPVVLEIQGSKRIIAKYYTGDLSLSEITRCVGVKEILRRSTMFQGKRQFEKWGKQEEKIIKAHKYVIVHNEWEKAQIMAVDHTINVFQNDFALREPFYSAEPWRPNDNPVLFCSAAYPAPFKGLHVAVRAIKILKRKYPDIQLRIAGIASQSGIRRDGYIAWIEEEIRNSGIEPNVTWLGSLSATQMVEETQKCSAVVIPSFIENYCLSLAESMMLGAPVVASFAGGMPCLAKHQETALFYPPGSEIMCAYEVDRLLSDRVLANIISANSRTLALKRNNRETILKTQIDIYHRIADTKKTQD